MLCAINVSPVFPIPDEVSRPLAEAAVAGARCEGLSVETEDV